MLPQINIGVLALQGAFKEHCNLIKRCGAGCKEIRHPGSLKGIDGLIIPGGESTAIGKLMVDYDLLDPVREKALNGLPVFGTCAGLVLLAKKIYNKNDQQLLVIMDMEVVRNAFGRQVDSFETDLEIDILGYAPFRAVFIRAPYITNINPNLGILATYKDKIVFARQGNLLACSFHPELTDDNRIHRYFLQIVKNSKI